ncbi:glutathione S-transferase [Alterisphingorhabdus coralli]|uniref:Glutathione S-transferase n=1 Tax=Alterisphingorhabdus coralli TaxID=3071408 RepID=A0AA97F8C5_9SPHN|nr:glutathione S-transferase [Parasphingorhabdus sp. SCSIO 66989]WOE75853.1 glutathione S-transferase [Parasphingorhabdus sp. SCSIO 66989]
MSGALPILYSFRRCPYAMRGRMALVIAGITAELREVSLKAKPEAMVAASPKATVPVVVLDDGNVLEESLAVMHWALEQNDPEGWLSAGDGDARNALIAANDGPFKHHLDRYKYFTRYDNADPIEHRAEAMTFIERLEAQLASHELQPGESQLFGAKRSMADIAIFPFVRQFANHDRGWFDVLPLPHIHAWLAGHLASDLFATAMQKEKPWAPGDVVTLFPLAA